MGFQLFIRICTINMSTTVEKSAKPKKATKSTTKKADTASAHPPSSTMVVKAIEDLKKKRDRHWQPLRNILGPTIKLTSIKNVFIRKALKSGIEKKTLVASSGMSGRFKLAKTESKPKPKKVAKKATPSKKKAKKPAAKKATPKKAEKNKVDENSQTKETSGKESDEKACYKKGCAKEKIVIKS